MSLQTGDSYRPLEPFKDRIRAGQYNRAMQMLGKLGRSMPANSVADASGLLTRRTPVAHRAISEVANRIFEVQDKADGDGVYLCMEVALDATEWTGTGGNDKCVYKSKVFAWALGIYCQAGMVVLDAGKYYYCDIAHVATLANRPLSPFGGTNWTRIWAWAKATVAWADTTNYYIGDLRTQTGKHYRCIRNHLSDLGTNDPATDTTEIWWHEIYVIGDLVYATINGEVHVFNCISAHVPADAKQPPETTYWNDLFLIEVLSLHELDVVSAYTPALGLYDLMRVLTIRDDEGNERYIGIPLSNWIRRVTASEDHPGSGSITCNLILDNEVEAVDGELGFGIEVYEASTEIKDDDVFYATNKYGKWYALETQGIQHIRRAKIQSSGVKATYLECKLLDSDGLETGSAINIYPVEHTGSNDLNSGDVTPHYTAGKNLACFIDLNGTWYTTRTFEDTIDKDCS